MSSRSSSLDDVWRMGLEVLARELGPVGLVRFLQQFETGQGDYTAERHHRIGSPDVRTLADQIRAAHSR